MNGDNPHRVEDLRRLLAGGETATTEFKSDRGPLSDNDLVEAVVYLANHRGGMVLLGVEDDGRVTGLHSNHRQSSAGMAALITARTVPSHAVEVRYTELPEGWVAVVEVPAARQPVAAASGKALIRFEDARGRPGCRPLYPHELVNWRAERSLADFSALPVAGATWDDLDALEFARLRRLIKEFHGDSTLLELSDTDIARALGLIRTDGDHQAATVAGLLLVGKENALQEYLPAHEVAFQVLHGTDVTLNEFRRWPLLRTLEWILEAFGIRNEERELNIGLFRIGVPAYDRRSFREAVNNAFIHRDYTHLGAVHVQMQDDHIRISNPGGFVEGVSTENLLVTEPRPRNPRLADAFKRVGLVERVGRGVSIIYNGQLRNGRLPPDYSRSTSTGVTVILPGGPADLNFVELIVSEENRKQRTFRVDEMLVLAHIWREREIDTHIAAALTQRPEAHIRPMLEGLVESGLVERRGRGKGRMYHLSASVYRAVGQPAAYVRAHGFEPDQMEQMILSYVRAHGRITRSQVMELCRVNERQATYLLQKLVEGRRLVPHGEGRGRSYSSKETDKTDK